VIRAAKGEKKNRGRSREISEEKTSVVKNIQLFSKNEDAKQQNHHQLFTGSPGLADHY